MRKRSLLGMIDLFDFKLVTSLKCWKFGSVWSVLGFVFDKKYVRVVSEREVGYGVVTEGSTCG